MSGVRAHSGARPIRQNQLALVPAFGRQRQAMLILSGQTDGVAGIAAGGGIDTCDRMVRVDGTLDGPAAIGGDGGIQAWDVFVGVAAHILCTDGPGRLIRSDCERGILASPVHILWRGGEGGIQSMLDGSRLSTMDGGGCHTGSAGMAGNNVMQISSEEGNYSLNFCGLALSNLTDLGGVAVAKMQVDKMELMWNGNDN